MFPLLINGWLDLGLLFHYRNLLILLNNFDMHLVMEVAAELDLLAFEILVPEVYVLFESEHLVNVVAQLVQ